MQFITIVTCDVFGAQLSQGSSHLNLITSHENCNTWLDNYINLYNESIQEKILMLFLWLYIPFIYKLVDVGYAFFHN